MLGTKVIEEKKSEFNGNLKVMSTLGMGTYIQSDGLTQSGGIVETIWKQTLRRINHQPSTINHCLILGLGGGTVAKLVRKKWPEAKITGVDIDPIMVELGEKYLGLREFDVDTKIGDAFDYLIKYQSSAINHFDLIIADLYNGDKYPEKFETSAFFSKINTFVSDGGMVIFNRLYFGDNRPKAVKFGRKLENFFKKADWVYPEANLMFLCHK